MPTLIYEAPMTAMPYKDYAFTLNKLKTGAHLNQRIGRDLYCQIIENDGVIGVVPFIMYLELVKHPDIIEKNLPKTKEYRKLRILVHKDFKDKDHEQ